MTKKMKQFNSLKKTTRVDFATYFGVIAAFVIVTVLQSNGSLKRSVIGLLVPICCYMSMAVSLNLTVGILGELSLGHAGFMSVGAFSGIVVSQSLAGLIPNGPVRLALSMFIGALLAALTILPEALRQFADFRMLIYAIVLIFVMLATNNPQAKAFIKKLLPHRRTAAEKED